MTSTPVEPSVQHTPGPWQIVEVGGKMPWAIESNLYGRIGVVYFRGDARVCAVAPDLLNVAKSALHLLETTSPELPQIAHLRALVARAEGRQA